MTNIEKILRTINYNQNQKKNIIIKIVIKIFKKK